MLIKAVPDVWFHNKLYHRQDLYKSRETQNHIHQ